MNTSLSPNEQKWIAFIGLKLAPSPFCFCWWIEFFLSKHKIDTCKWQTDKKSTMLKPNVKSLLG